MKQIKWKQIIERPSWVLGTVDSLDPLTVITGTGGTIYIGTCLVSGLVVGDTVEVRREGRAATLTGKHYTY